MKLFQKLIYETRPAEKSTAENSEFPPRAPQRPSLRIRRGGKQEVHLLSTYGLPTLCRDPRT